MYTYRVYKLSPYLKPLLRYAEVKDIYIPIDFHSGKRKGFAFIELFTPKSIHS